MDNQNQSYEDESLGMSSLCSACVIGNMETVHKLLSFGADIESKAKGGMTPLMLTALYGHKKIFNKLLQYGANLQAKNEAGFTALDYIDLTRIMTNQIPFSDVTFFEKGKNRKFNDRAGDYNKTEYGLLYRRKKSLPKIKIQQQFITNWYGKSYFSAKCSSDNYRYSPYLRNKESVGHKSLRTEKTRQTQILSPNVANFFGSVLQMQKSCERLPSSPKKIVCPTLSKVLIDYGCEDFISIFNYHEVNYQIFCTLTDVDLYQIGIKNEYYRNLLIQIIKNQH